MDLEEAVERGKKFLQDKADYPLCRLLSVDFEEDAWVVRFYASAFEEGIVKIMIDNKTGKIIGYEQSKESSAILEEKRRALEQLVKKMPQKEKSQKILNFLRDIVKRNGDVKNGN